MACIQFSFFLMDKERWKGYSSITPNSFLPLAPTAQYHLYLRCQKNHHNPDPILIPLSTVPIVSQETLCKANPHVAATSKSIKLKTTHRHEVVILPVNYIDV